MKKIFVTTISLILLASFAIFLPQKKTVNSEPPTSVKDTLSSSQLSYFARVGNGTTMGENIVRVNTTSGASRTTNNLFRNDIVCIGNSGAAGCTQYTVDDIGNTLYFQTATTLPATNAYISNYIVATRSAQHVITFTPQTNITGGKWQFLLRATSHTDERSTDGMPDMYGFDLGGNAVGGTGVGASLATANITCPFGATASIGATVSVTDSNGIVYGYHNILCTLSAGATNPIGTTATWTIGGASVANSTQITNPSRQAANSEGTADVYNFFIRHLDSGNLLYDGDTARGQIAVVESVRVSATVDPTISFIIDNNGVTTVGTSVCPGATLSTGATNTTATQVPFGSLKLSGNWNDLAQRISVNTNAVNGYVVQVYEDAPLTKIGTSTTLPNTICDSACTSGVGGEGNWTNNASTPSKFGYSLSAVAGAGGTLAFTTGTSNFKYKPFGVGAANAATVLYNNYTPAAAERAYVCYRITITNTQSAGNYDNKVIYVATATF